MNHRTLFSFAAGLAWLSLCAPLTGQTIYEQMKVRSPTPTPNHLTTLRYGAGKFLALGESATILSSDDGVDWTAHVSGYTRSLSDIAFGNGVFVVCGADSGTVLTSADLETWVISRPAGVPFNCWGITFHDGRFYLCGSEGTVASSADGVQWEESDTGLTSDLEDIVFAGGQFICVGADNSIVTSQDGEQWTLRPTGIPLQGLKDDFLSVSWLNSLYVVGGKDGTVLTSPDGIDWTLREYSEGNDWFYGGVYQDGFYYLTGRQGRLRKTTDFTGWDTVQTADPADNDIYGIVSQGGITVAVGRSGTINTSPDLANWTSRKGGFSQSFSGLAFGDGLFVSTDFDGVIRTSMDSVEWTGVFTMPNGTGLSDVFYGDGKFVGVSSSSEVTQSIDGMLWSVPVKQFDGFPGIQGVRFANGRWFLFGRDGLLRSSANLSNWTVSDVQPAEEILDLTFANGVYVAAGANGSIFTSIDGFAWEARQSGTNHTLYAIAYGNGRFVAGGSGAAMVTSLNGIDWTSDGVGFPPSNTISLFHREGQFVAFGSLGQLGLSVDGKQWDVLNLGVLANVTGFAEGNDRLVAAGSNGVILSTDPLLEYSLTLSWEGAGSVTSDPPGTAFRQGTVITLTAAPGENHSFLGWGGAASGNANPLTIVMDSDKTVSAVFQLALTGYALWRVSEFTAAERNDPGISGPSADPDGDGSPNVMEYLGGTPPKEAGGAAFTSAGSARIGNTDYPVLTYVRRKGITDVSERVEVSNDLLSWRYNGDGGGQNYSAVYNLIDASGDREAVSIRALAPARSGAPVFLRLRVAYP